MLSELSNLFELWDCSFCTSRAGLCPREDVSGGQIMHSFKNTLLESKYECCWKISQFNHRFLSLSGHKLWCIFIGIERCNRSYLLKNCLLCELEVPVLWISCIPTTVWKSPHLQKAAKCIFYMELNSIHTAHEFSCVVNRFKRKMYKCVLLIQCTSTAQSFTLAIHGNYLKIKRGLSMGWYMDFFCESWHK